LLIFPETGKYINKNRDFNKPLVGKQCIKLPSSMGTLEVARE
jgi:hypothetical protein